MIEELPEGQTHSYNDGCGEPAHNQQQPSWKKTFQILIKDFADNIYFSGDPMRTKGTTEFDLDAFIASTLEAELKKRDEEWETELVETYNNIIGDFERESYQIVSDTIAKMTGGQE